MHVSIDRVYYFLPDFLYITRSVSGDDLLFLQLRYVNICFDAASIWNLHRLADQSSILIADSNNQAHVNSNE